MAQMTIEEDLILFGLAGRTKEEVLAAMADNLARLGYVKESYRDALLAREKRFATGLPTGGCGVAIPHTDIAHVNRAAISIAILDREVDFVIMGEEAETVPVKIVFMLAMEERHAQLALLQKLTAVFQDRTALDFLRGAKNKAEIQAFMTRKLG